MSGKGRVCGVSGIGGTNSHDLQSPCQALGPRAPGLALFSQQAKWSLNQRPRAVLCLAPVSSGGEDRVPDTLAPKGHACIISMLLQFSNLHGMIVTSQHCVSGAGGALAVHFPPDSVPPQAGPSLKLGVFFQAHSTCWCKV